MIVNLQIQSLERREMKDGGVIYELRGFDVSKPHQLRTQGEFVTYLGENSRKDLPSGDLTDERVTVIVRSVSSLNGTTKLKGQVLHGMIPAEELVRTVQGEIPTRPEPKSDLVRAIQGETPARPESKSALADPPKPVKA